MKILIDMNLTPVWVEYFAGRRIESVHWSDVGNPRAEDPEIMVRCGAGNPAGEVHGDINAGRIAGATQKQLGCGHSPRQEPNVTIRVPTVAQIRAAVR